MLLIAPAVAGDPPEQRGTCGLVALREATSMGQVLHGCTLAADAGEPVAGTLREVLRVGEREIPYVALERPGHPGAVAGLNARGLSVSFEPIGNALPELAGPPGNAVQRVLAQAASLEDAERLLRTLQPPTSARFTVADGHRLDARVFEVHGTHVNVRRPFEGLVFGEDPEARLECFLGTCDPAVPRGTGLDDGALREAVASHVGRLRLPALVEALSRDPVAHAEIGAVCVLEPQQLRMHYGSPSRGGAPPPAWRTVDLLARLPKDARSAYATPWSVTTTGDVVVEAPTRLGKVTLTRVEFDSPAPSGVAQNDKVHGILYKPETVKGAVIALPAWKESNLAGQSVLALRLAADGYAVLVMPLPWQVDRAVPGVSSGSWTLSDNLARTRAAFFQGAADVARASLWLEQAQGVPPARQAVMGVSLGGHVAALAYGAYPQRFGAGVFLLAGGNFETALMNPNRTTGRMRKALLDRGVTPEEAKDLIEAIDGVTWADPARGKGVLLVGADADDVVPPANVKALATAYGKDARLEWVPGDHYALLLHLPRALGWVVEHLGKALPPP